MPQYLVQAAYTPDAWAAQTKTPQNVLERVQPVVDQLGGTVIHIWYAFGEYDVVGVIEFPDNESAAAFSMAVSSGHALKTIKTTPLMGIEEGIGAMKKAAKVGYRPPRG